MASQRVSEWTSGERSGPVSIGTHSLYLHVSGPDYNPEEPVAIIIQGIGTSIKAFAAVRRLLTSFIRTYAYERSGYGQSEPSPNKPLSTIIAAELDLLLEAADIPPPYILVAHSWGGMLAREYISLRPHDVAGLVLIDANTEHMFERPNWRAPCIRAVTQGLDHHAVTGLRQNHKLTEAEWRAYRAEENSSRHKKQAAAECAMYKDSFAALAARQQLHRTPPLLGDRPVVVVRGLNRADFEKLFRAGEEVGQGTEQDRAAFRKMLQTWEGTDKRLQLAQLTLSRQGRCVVVGWDGGHNVHLTRPDVVADATMWVLDRVIVGRQRDGADVVRGVGAAGSSDGVARERGAAAGKSRL